MDMLAIGSLLVGGVAAWLTGAQQRGRGNDPYFFARALGFAALAFFVGYMIYR